MNSIPLIGWFVLSNAFALAVFLYWAPTLVAYLRKSSRLPQVVVVNGFLGWTLLGWVVALVIALNKDYQETPLRREKNEPHEYRN